MTHRNLRPNRLRVCLISWLAALACFAPAIVYGQPAESIEYYGLDAIGSVRVVFDSSGTILGRMDYGPFGPERRPALACRRGDMPGCFATARRA